MNTRVSLFVATWLGCIFPLQLANTCGWGYDMDESILSPFHSEMLDLPELFPFYYSEHFYNGDPNSDWSENGGSMNEDIFDGTSANVDEWFNYFNSGATKEDISAIIYQTQASDYESFTNYLKGKKNVISEQWVTNSVLKWWVNNPKDPSFKYLTLAKQIEPLVQPVYWWDEVRTDTAQLLEYKNEALSQLKKSKSEFITLRYAYQAARAAHYTGNYKECISIYQKYVAPVQTEAQIKYWTMSLMAGAEQRLNNDAVAAYYHAMVFDKCWSRRLSSKRDFYINNEETWQACLNLCKNDHEKNILWFFTGVSQYNSAVPALNEMLKIDPASKEIELLLSREIEKIQRNTMPERWWSGIESESYEQYQRTSIEPNDVSDIIDVLENGIAINKMRTPGFWYNAAAFLYFIVDDAENCNNMCVLAKQSANGDVNQIEQTRIISILNKVNDAGEITTAVEKELINDLKWLADRENSVAMAPFKADAYRIVMYRLMQYYLEDNQSLLAELCRARAVEYYDIYLQPEKAPIDELYEFFTSNKKSAFESFLSAQYPYNADDMLEIKGTLLMREDKLEQAAATFKKIQDPDATLYSLSADPFVIHINDCHDCDFEEYPTDLNKLSLVEKMIALKKQAQTDELNRAQIYHELGNAYYNISYWGNAWNALDYYRCHGCETYSHDPEDSYFYYYNDEYDLTEAKKYYTLATRLSSGKQFAALNYFMLAKCEQNDFYRGGEVIDHTFKTDEQQINFGILHKLYSDTEFYRQAIDECKYFNYYVNKH
jgi:hypothetical protein